MYYREMEQLLLEQTGADRVFVFASQVRNSTKAWRAGHTRLPPPHGLSAGHLCLARAQFGC